jgi:hypothetical protein
MIALMMIPLSCRPIQMYLSNKNKKTFNSRIVTKN